MKSDTLRVLALGLLATSLVLGAGCGKQTRGNADAEANRARTPAEGGATSTAGDAGSAKNFGDTQQKKAVDDASQKANAPAVDSANSGASATKNTTTPPSK